MTAHVTISGQVQGIGFRQFIKEEAEVLGLTGWAKNTSEGNVEAMLVGEKEAIDTMIKSIKRGPENAHVTGVEISWGNAKEVYKDFSILMD